MRKAIFFFLSVFLLLVIAYTQTIPKKEKFQNLMGVTWTSTNGGTPEALYTKLPITQPVTVNLAEAGVGNIQPSPPKVSDLPSAPITQRAKETPSPYRDPTTEPAKYIQILGVKEDLQAFFGFQAPILEERNDPAIQLPLTRARGDMGELIDLQSVMEKNPGLPSRITNARLNDIRSNLRYLRSALRDLEASGAVHPKAIEAFQNAVNSTPVLTDKRATLRELQEFQIKVVIEINRLSASGTSDPVIEGRLNTLNRIKNDLDDVIAQLEKGALTPDTVPILASDIEKALPVLGKPTDPLPQLLKKNELPPAVASLFPGGLSPKDSEQASQINNIVQGYMKNLFEGSSWGMNLMFKYDNPNVLKLKANDKGLPGVNEKINTVSSSDKKASNEGSLTNLRKGTDPSYSKGLPGTSSDRYSSPAPVRLDWKLRMEQIKKQIRSRGLNPRDFGAFPDNVNVSNEFSWRGHTLMVCSRLNATADPGLGVTVGCPPSDWEGWRE
jgi:hypothetical protein